MSIIGSNILAGAAGSGVSGYEIEQSLRFNNGDSAHLHRTPSSAGSQTTFTLSVWVKSSVPSSGSEYFYATHNGSRWNGILRRSGNYDFGVDESGASAPKVVTNAKLRDPSAWYHLVMAYDTTQATSTDRVKIWINGELQSINTSAGSYPNLNHGSTFNRAAKHWIGALDDTASVYYTKDFYLAEYHLLDGTAVTNAEDFGEYDDNGVWRPIEYAGGNYGTVGYYLKFDPSATNGIGHDHSGNGNNWTASGFTTSGTGTDVMSDTPTNNYATLNPVDNASGATLANGNLETTSGAASYKSNFGTMFASSGKWYAEFTVLAGSNDSRMIPGVGTKQTSVTTNLGNDTYSYSINYDSGTSTIYKRTNNATTALTSTGNLTTNSVVMIALDLDNNKLWFGQDGTWFDSGAPASGTNQIFSIAAGEYTFMPCTYSDGKFAINFGQRAFAYTPPTGFKALNTSNLPAPDIADGSQYFNTLLYTGNGSTQTISGLDFSPDFVWVKHRSVAGSHNLFDQVRGTGKLLISNSTNSESGNTGDLLGSFNSDGFQVNVSYQGGFGGSTNNSGDTYAAWCWDANGSGSSNTDGSITSTVSANASAGFSIISYASGASGQKTVGHGLGVAPDFIITKSRDGSTFNWAVFHSAVCDTTSKYLKLNTTDGLSTSSTIWGAALPTSTVFGITSGGGVEANDNCIAYCFAEVEGYSKFGSYTGNGSADGPFVFCGFKPRWILTKSSTLSSVDSNWRITDTARNTYNLSDDLLWANLSNAGGIYNGFDICSNGFKIKTASNEVNSSGQTYIFAAFAEHPFGGSGVSPATAR